MEADDPKQIFVTIPTGNPDEPYQRINLQQMADAFFGVVWDLKSEIATLRAELAKEPAVTVGDGTPERTAVAKRLEIVLDSREQVRETARLESPEQVREAIGVLATELVRLKEVQEATAELVKGMDARIRTFTTLLDDHHDALTKLGYYPPRPKGASLAN